MLSVCQFKKYQLITTSFCMNKQNIIWIANIGPKWPKIAKFRLKRPIFGLHRISRHSHYDFLKVDHKTRFYTKNYDFLQWSFETISLKCSKMGSQTEGPNVTLIFKQQYLSTKMPITSWNIIGTYNKVLQSTGQKRGLHTNR